MKVDIKISPAQGMITDSYVHYDITISATGYSDRDNMRKLHLCWDSDNKVWNESGSCEYAEAYGVASMALAKNIKERIKKVVPHFDLVTTIEEII